MEKKKIVLNKEFPMRKCPVRTACLLLMIIVFSVCTGLAKETVAPNGQPKIKEDLQFCRDDKMGVKFLCDPDWELVTDKNMLMVVLSSNPVVSMTISKSDKPVIFIQQLTESVIKEMGQYAPGFKTEMVRWGQREVVKVEGIADGHPGTVLRDYYLIKDMNLYGLLFATESSNGFAGFEPLIDRILESFQFVDVLSADR